MSRNKISLWETCIVKRSYFHPDNLSSYLGQAALYTYKQEISNLTKIQNFKFLLFKIKFPKKYGNEKAKLARYYSTDLLSSFVGHYTYDDIIESQHGKKIIDDIFKRYCIEDENIFYFVSRSLWLIIVE